MKKPHLLPQLVLKYENKIHIQGQVIWMKPKHLKLKKSANPLYNIKLVYRYFSQKPTKNKQINITVDDVCKEIKIDENGFFHTDFDIRESKKINQVNIDYKLDDGTKVIVPEVSSSFIYNLDNFTDEAVISDIDDTILVSHSTRIRKRIKHLFLKNPHSRKPVSDMAELYNFLTQGKSMIFYISNSQMNLFLMISTFIKKHMFPEGPLLLHEYKVVKEFFKKKDKNKDHDFHKFRSIMFVMHLMKNTRFVLVGDNSQHDPEIYQEIARKYPNRVKAVLIRTYSQKSKRENELEKISQDLESKNIPFITGEDGSELKEKFEEHFNTVNV
ncbi:phosphatase domain-containing protein [Mangrovivirga cuniculi]|uniref:Phosphatidate phosphatase APP1 catalytic domain-containing protein n=1 Tax=Mangrovivirga cuniculi TaxID=2715131 RepID=A0A4D7K2E1_9BACT|nr:phosphatase domain-containing protein [Mangrovivirga cuniculi]QCK15054.1 hypothetical protein DCC35_09995 [Mangrovivirga cuniculi]